MDSSRSLADVGERRTNVVLRALLDELLDRVREMHRRGTAWPAGERERAEMELEMIIARVKREALESELPRASDD